MILQEKFDRLRAEIPQLGMFGCEIRVKDFGFLVQRPKGNADEPTVGDNIVSLGKILLCLPILGRIMNGREIERKTILKGVHATFKPSATTLVLGPPGCGKVCRSSVRYQPFSEWYSQRHFHRLILC